MRSLRQRRQTEKRQAGVGYIYENVDRGHSGKGEDKGEDKGKNEDKGEDKGGDTGEGKDKGKGEV